MGTSQQGGMLPGTQVGLLRKTCSRSPVWGWGIRALWALPSGTILCLAGAGRGPLSSANCPFRVSMLACESESHGREQADTSLPLLYPPVPGEGSVLGTLLWGLGAPPAGQGVAQIGNGRVEECEYMLAVEGCGG